MTTHKEALTLALEALERGETELRWKAITAIKEALAQPEQEPDDGYCTACDGWKCTSKAGCVALDNPPPQRKPLTDDEAFELIEQDYQMEEYAQAALQLIRRTEAAHGIKE